MVMYDRLHDKQERDAFSTVEECDLPERSNELGWFAISGPMDEITPETIADIKAFLRYVQEQKKPAHTERA